MGNWVKGSISYDDKGGVAHDGAVGSAEDLRLLNTL